MATGQVVINIADVGRVFDAIADEAPIPLDGAGQPLYTKAQWGKIWLDNLLTRKVARYETKVAQLNAAVPEDPDLVTIA